VEHTSPAVEGLVAELAPVLAASPTEAVLSAWKRVEAALSNIAKREGLSEVPIVTLMNELVEKKRIAPATRDSLNGLRQLRNLAVHGPSGEVSPERAREFLTMADAILWVIRDEQQRPPST
jgi:hypothetical protein